MTTYEYDPFNPNVAAVKEDPATVQQAFQDFREGPFQEALDYGDALWEEDETEDFSVVEDLKDNGWDESDPLQYAAKWTWINYEHTTDDISHYAIFDVYGGTNSYFVDDQVKGYESVVQRYAAEKGIRPIFDRRVLEISYDVGNDSNGYKAQVLSNDSAGRCFVYRAKRVISTVSVGVLNNNLIDFQPPLSFPAPSRNPMEMYLYQKIFYQFPTTFWDNSDYILTLKNAEREGNNGLCFQWQNMENYIPGSRTLMCTLTTPEFDKLVGGRANRNTATLSPQQLRDLLEPLRRAYPNFVEPVDSYYPPINTDRDFGYGAYSDWKVGYTPWDYYRFFGGGSDNYYLATAGPLQGDDDEVYEGCTHNGCNSKGEWILYLSGAASCLEYYEFVYGGDYAGESAASYAMQSLGYPLEADWYDKCYHGIAKGEEGGGWEGDKEKEKENDDEKDKENNTDATWNSNNFSNQDKDEEDGKDDGEEDVPSQQIPRTGGATPGGGGIQNVKITINRKGDTP